jgi:hypothetical protein
VKPATAPLIGIHVLGNALLLLLGYLWLGMSEADGPHLLSSIVVVLIFLLATIWLYATTLAFFQSGSRSVLEASRVAARHLLPLMVLVLAALAIYGAVAWWTTFIPREGFVIASFLTLTLRHPVKPEAAITVLNAVVWILRWVALPVFLLPAAAEISVHGWSSFRGAPLRRSRRWIYWLEVGLLSVCAFWAPLKLLGWIPEIPNFNLQMLSFLGRLSVGYLLFVASLLALAFVTAGGKPPFTQDNTVSSP